MKACENCVNAEIVNWEWDEKNKKSIPYYWCEKHKLETTPTFLCYMYDVKEGIDAKHTPADQMKCETCIFCSRKEKEK